MHEDADKDAAAVVNQARSLHEGEKVWFRRWAKTSPNITKTDCGEDEKRHHLHVFKFPVCLDDTLPQSNAGRPPSPTVSTSLCPAAPPACIRLPFPLPVRPTEMGPPP